MMLHGAPSQSPPLTPSVAAVPTAATGSCAGAIGGQPSPLRRKRKADSQDNERLSKRLSLLNLEQNGSKLYVPVETPSAPPPLDGDSSLPGDAIALDETMQLDDSKHKVYIYNIDDELSDDESVDQGKLVFLPDIEKHLKANRIPPHILANKDGELAGMQVVLYSDPKSLSVPENKDSVRKAIIESRHRLREQQRHNREGTSPSDAMGGQPVVPENAGGMDVDMEMDMD
ncbi:hypothetical protein B0I35DRAFT_428928 [Stachybotrys elegans]|uniref:Uncharacterized protein n=1 Tax=Stachybotrys elegans TaxID=80388 RepID=A0A8K0SZY4_9HYPO|nr:hypothetical protein B0I35DRAFT_428928 [Stachybotrys elegans]